ncbi:MAG: hypothetical protein MK186_13855, partial [Henriciella sp.]|nr:hypothetical protein [Henriciella sp.]
WKVIDCTVHGFDLNDIEAEGPAVELRTCVAAADEKDASYRSYREASRRVQSVSLLEWDCVAAVPV